MSKQLLKAYEPQKYEDKIYKTWEESGFFNPDNLDLPADAKPYTIILPPPNITDKLHLGHSSMLAIEDLLIRYHRMKGYRALWVPGTDHAAIATQNVVEKKLLKETGKSRHDFGREKFLEKVWEFLRVTQSTILKQTRRMGASLDWSREAFTLDSQRVAAVRKMFIDMYKTGVIYRGERIVNWCPRCLSTLADDEVEYKEQKAVLYYFKYGQDFPITIATTRPETKLGDTAVAVNPKDKRYKDLIGKEFSVAFVGVKLQIKIIADRQVDMKFGTGALGVTPAHAQVDWQMAEENKLKIVKVINENGLIHAGLGDYSGLKVIAAREKIVERLRKNKLIEKEEEINNNLSVCYRCDTPIEPLPSRQWFVAVDKKLKHLGGKSIKEKAVEAAKNKDIKFVPDRFGKQYIHWMENLHDWCISRQIWFGHRIPVWYKEKSKVDNEIYVGIEPPKGEGLIQDEDSLDTWLSSGLWTFSTLVWQNTYKDNKKTGDLAKFHPTQVLETGYDILTLWVSRMIMMSIFAVDEIPFENVYLHGMVLDKQGKKMSKSKGNGIDPIDMVEQFGADAVRLSLLIGSTPGNDLRVSEEKIAGYRNFVNKLLNVIRYILSNDEERVTNNELDQEKFTSVDYWILRKMFILITLVTEDLNNYQFSQAGERLREFTWNDLADWYLEATKFSVSSETKKILFVILKDLLKLWHPFIPFVTEVIWKEFNDSDLIIEKWPDEKYYARINYGNNCSGFDLAMFIIKAIRTARAENKIEPSRKIKAVFVTGEQEKKLIKENEKLIKVLKLLEL